MVLPNPVGGPPKSTRLDSTESRGRAGYHARRMLAEKRRQIGISAVVGGVLLLAAGVLIAHFTGLAEKDSLDRPILPDIPRGWVLVTAGQLVALAGSQLAILGVYLGFIHGQEMTWTRAGVAGLLTWFEFVIFFGIVPSEWLALAQGPLRWGSKPALTIPRFLVLNNHVEISYKALKEIIEIGYYQSAVVATGFGIYWIQERKKRKAVAPPPKFSTYGRPLVRGSGNGGPNGA